MSNRNQFEEALSECPIIAILRGVTPAEVLDISDALFRAGIRIVEVPMNSPEPLESIKSLVAAMGERLVVGAGTVIEPRMVNAIGDAGGQIIVSPNTDQLVLARSHVLNLVPIPGVLTPTDIFKAANQGAEYLKLFPADQVGTSFVRAVRPTMPESLKLLAVGGVSAATAPDWLAAGTVGLGCGGSLYRPGDSADQVFRRASEIVEAIRH
ncbi:MAG: 2-dehydro-3-deoxy-6-phosphogalactonate aldolase [Pseudomonadota bacterium]